MTNSPGANLHSFSWLRSGELQGWCEQTAKANGLVPFDYLNYLLSENPILQPDNSIDHLLPWEFIKR
jgi:hypothetical protein